MGALTERLFFAYINKNDIFADFADLTEIDDVLRRGRNQTETAAGPGNDDFLYASGTAVKNKIRYES